MSNGSDERLLASLRRRHERRRRLLPRALLVGAVGGLVASFFRAAVERGEDLRAALSERLHPFGVAGFLAFSLLGAAAVTLAVWLVRRVSPVASGSGIPHLKAVLHRHRPLPGLRLVAVKFAGGVAAIAAGLTLGREGPTIQMGGAVGGWLSQGVFSRRLRATAHERQVMIAAGAGAGLAAAFNAPLAGLIFVLEEIQKNFAAGIFTVAFLASVTSDTVSRVLFGQRAVLPALPIDAPPLPSIPLFAVLGCLIGVLGVAFNRGLLLTLRQLDRLRTRGRLVFAGGAGFVVAGLAWSQPRLVGGGARLLEQALAGHGAIGVLLAVLALRFVLTLGSYGTGAPGGIFAPLLVLGSLAGLAVGLAAAAWWPVATGSLSAWPVAGMAALFAATVRAPLTGIVLLVEMTGSYSLMLPLLVASFSAQWMAELLGDRPIYDALLERELEQSSPERPEGALLLELDVMAGAPFAGRRLADLGLPSGLLVAAVQRHGADHVATAGMQLRAGDRLAVMVAPEAAGAVGELRRGLGLDH